MAAGMADTLERIWLGTEGNRFVPGFERQVKGGRGFGYD